LESILEKDGKIISGWRVSEREDNTALDRGVLHVKLDGEWGIEGNSSASAVSLIEATARVIHDCVLREAAGFGPGDLEMGESRGGKKGEEEDSGNHFDLCFGRRMSSRA